MKTLFESGDCTQGVQTEAHDADRLFGSSMPAIRALSISQNTGGAGTALPTLSFC